MRNHQRTRVRFPYRASEHKNKMIKLNLGCGNDYRKGWINVDFNKEVKADVYADFAKKLPFKDNYADVVLLDNVLEHIMPERYFAFLEELYRICKHGAIVHIYTPHYSGMYAFGHPAHYKYFGIGSFDFMRHEDAFNGERYTKARFDVCEQKLFFFHRKLINHPILSKLPINWIFNFSEQWQKLMERFQFFGFDESYFKLRAWKK